MAPRVATRHTPVIAAFSQRVCADGKPQQLALPARMPTLLPLLTAILRHETPGLVHPLPVA
ncbi:MAG TPA: hypothetical protein VGS80_21765 [Ktedonobacterales bacterium]|nr:hypothetical protein [Ktedonobacterales bacterium]